MLRKGSAKKDRESAVPRGVFGVVVGKSVMQSGGKSGFMDIADIVKCADRPHSSSHAYRKVKVQPTSVPSFPLSAVVSISLHKMEKRLI